MIITKKPVTLVEVKEIVKDMEDRQPIQDYLKTFTLLSKDKAEKLKDELLSLNSLRIKEEDIVKLIDFVPKDKEDVNKIFIDTSLGDEEINAILEITKKY